MNTIVLFLNQDNAFFEDYKFQIYLDGIEMANEERFNDYYADIYIDGYKLFLKPSQRVIAGDRFFVFYCGERSKGICISGYLASDFHQYEEQKGKGRLINDLDLVPDYMIHPNHFPILSVDLLMKSIPEFEWDDNRYGRFIEPNLSVKLEQLWHDFIEKNSGVFVHWSVIQSYDFSNFVPQEEEEIYISLSDEGKIEAHNYRGDLRIQCDDVETTQQKAKEFVDEKYGKTKKIKFQYTYYFCENHDFVERVLKFISNSCKGKNDKSGRPILRHIVKSSLFDCLHYSRILAILLRLIEEGLITENDIREEVLPTDLVETVHVLIKKDEDTYESYIDKVSKNQNARDYMISAFQDRLNIIYKYKELQPDDFVNLNNWLKAYHKLMDIRLSGTREYNQ